MFKYLRDMTIHYLSTSNLINWIKLLWKNKFNISLRGIPKAIYITLCNILTLPLFLLEQLIFGRRVHKAELHPEPVFILGHWRSGHHLSAQPHVQGSPVRLDEYRAYIRFFLFPHRVSGPAAFSQNNDAQETTHGQH